jgi:carboxyl-terminal processing protease
MTRVEKSYVAPVGDDVLVNNALKGMLTGLDPHSDYMDEREFREMMSTSRGQFGGVGIELSLRAGVPEVISPIDGTPAFRAGIQPGDLIVKIDGQPTLGMRLEQIVDKLRGDIGTKVILTIARTAHPPVEAQLTRALIHIVSVKTRFEPDGIGYVRISTFGENTPDELEAAITRFKQQSRGRLKGFVLDLRNDPGGLLDAAVEVSGAFLDGGTVVATRGRGSDDNQTFAVPEGGDLIRDTPMVVLINNASASAAEIVAGALQDHHRATIIGTRSFGKGSVQTVIPLEGRGALRLTTALYYTPSGRSIQGEGITPDIVVSLPKDEQVANAVVEYESDLFGAFKNTGALDGKAGPALPGVAGGGAADDHPIKPALIGTPQDEQLIAAFKFLRKPPATRR